MRYVFKSLIPFLGSAISDPWFQKRDQCWSLIPQKMVQPDLPDPSKNCCFRSQWLVIPDPEAVIPDPTLPISDLTPLIPDPTPLIPDPTPLICDPTYMYCVRTLLKVVQHKPGMENEAGDPLLGLQNAKQIHDQTQPQRRSNVLAVFRFIS